MTLSKAQKNSRRNWIVAIFVILFFIGIIWTTSPVVSKVLATIGIAVCIWVAKTVIEDEDLLA